MQNSSTVVETASCVTISLQAYQKIANTPFESKNGFILGMYDNITKNFHITEVFPCFSSLENIDEDIEATEFLSKCRDSNIDHAVLGYFTCKDSDEFFSAIISKVYNDQEKKIHNSVFIVFNNSISSINPFPIKAFKIKDGAQEIDRMDRQLSFDFFEEMDMTVCMSNLETIYILESLSGAYKTCTSLDTEKSAAVFTHCEKKIRHDIECLLLDNSKLLHLIKQSRRTGQNFTNEKQIYRIFRNNSSNIQHILSNKIDSHIISSQLLDFLKHI